MVTAQSTDTCRPCFSRVHVPSQPRAVHRSGSVKAGWLSSEARERETAMHSRTSPLSFFAVSRSAAPRDSFEALQAVEGCHQELLDLVVEKLRDSLALPLLGPHDLAGKRLQLGGLQLQGALRLVAFGAGPQGCDSEGKVVRQLLQQRELARLEADREHRSR